MNAPDGWFIQAEAQFDVTHIRSENTKYAHLLASLTPDSLDKVIDVVRAPPDENRYTVLKHALLTRLSASEEQRIGKLLYHAEMGDSSPSEFHRRLTQLAGSSTDVSERLVKRLWLGRLPKAIEIAVISLGERDIQEILGIADKIHEASKGVSVNECVGNPVDSQSTELASLRSEIRELKDQIKNLALSEDRGRSRGRSDRRNRKFSRGRSNNRSQSEKRKCWYHNRFGSAATKCVAPCSFKPVDPKNE